MVGGIVEEFSSSPLCSRPGIPRRGDPHTRTTCRITRTTLRSTASPLLVSISCCGVQALGHPGTAIRLLSLRLQFPALHMFAQEKAGGWGGGGRERLGTEHCTSLSKRQDEGQDRFCRAPSATPTHLSAELWGDVVGVKSRLLEESEARRGALAFLTHAFLL